MSDFDPGSPEARQKGRTVKCERFVGFLCSRIAYNGRGSDDKRECLEMIWSEGKACRGCTNETCHRVGMTPREAAVDNRRVVEERRAALRKEQADLHARLVTIDLELKENPDA